MITSIEKTSALNSCALSTNIVQKPTSPSFDGCAASKNVGSRCLRSILAFWASALPVRGHDDVVTLRRTIGDRCRLGAGKLHKTQINLALLEGLVLLGRRHVEKGSARSEDTLCGICPQRRGQEIAGKGAT
jgi:hypothetical protein